MYVLRIIVQYIFMSCQWKDPSRFQNMNKQKGSSALVRKLESILSFQSYTSMQHLVHEDQWIMEGSSASLMIEWVVHCLISALACMAPKYLNWAKAINRLFLRTETTLQESIVILLQQLSWCLQMARSLSFDFSLIPYVGIVSTICLASQSHPLLYAPICFPYS